MVAVRVAAYRGASMRLAPHLIATEQASYALNARLDDGRLRSLRDTGAVLATLAKAPTIESLYRFAGSHWFHWRSDVDVVRGPVAGDTEQRTYFTGDGAPKMTYAGLATGTDDLPAASYLLGVPAPLNAASVTVSGTADSEQDVLEPRAYVYTYVSAKGEEGPPSPPSNIVSLREGEVADLADMSAAPSGNYNITTKRVYRLATDATSSEYHYVDEIDVAATTYADSIPTAELVEVLPSRDWHPPPADLAGLTSLANGVLAGFRANELCLSAAELPHAWPLQYRYATDHPIVAIGALGAAIFVATTATPYVVQASSPGAASMVKADTPYPCVAKRGLVDMGNAIVYPGPEGVMAWTGGEVRNITENLLGEDDWQALSPESMHAYRYRDRYVAFYDTGTETGALVLEPSGEQMTFMDVYADAGWTDPHSADLYLVQGDSVVRFDAGAALTHTWHSKRFVLPRPANMAALEILADVYPVDVILLGDGVERYEGSVDHERPVPLPARYLANSFEIRLAGVGEVRGFALAETVEELKAT